ncbi:hypothetical protein ACFLYU_02140 [Candidatus Dependentiae bacterium]
MRIKKFLLRCKVLILLFSFFCNIFMPAFATSSTVKLRSGGQLSFSVSPKKDVDQDLDVDSDIVSDNTEESSSTFLLDKLRTSANLNVGSENKKPQTPTAPILRQAPVSAKASTGRQDERVKVGQKAKKSKGPKEPHEKTKKIEQRDALPEGKEKEEEKIVFNFEDVDLVNVAAYVESLFNVKFITDEAIKPIAKGGKSLSGNKVSFKTQKPMTRDQAWGLFVAFLNMAGFALVPQGGPREGVQFYRVRIIKSAVKSAIPIYINIDSEKLPNNDQLIRYGYFVKDCPLDTIHKVLKSLKSTEAPLLILNDHKAFIITDKSYNIKVLMKIVKELDKVTMPQSMSVLKLYKVDAIEVQKIYNNLTKNSQDSTVAARLFGPKGPSKSLYFPKKTKMIVEKRTNSLILLGTVEGIKKVESFVRDYIDIDVTTPYSPLHIYELKYAYAVTIANMMNKLVQFGAKKRGGLRGGDKYFKNMKFTAEKEGNRLIIRGDYDDYLKAKEVLDKIDEPPVQVAIEILILAIDVQDQRELGAQIRNKFLSPDGSRLNFQTSGITLGGSARTVLPRKDPDTHKLNGALRLLGDLVNLVTGATAGNTVLSLGSDRYGVWGIFGILSKITNTQIVSNPFLTATNNTKARVKLGSTKRVVSATVVGNTETQAFDNYNAFIDVEVTPHINSAGMIVMDVKIGFDSFSGDTAKNKRLIETSIVAANNEVLALGGLLKNKEEDDLSRTPILGKIPILGWFFKNKKKTNEKEDLLVLITPHVIDPAESIKEFTKRHVKEYKDTLEELEVVKNSKDPIDRSFFKDKKSEFDLESFIFTRDNKDSLFKKNKKEKETKASKKRKKRKKRALRQAQGERGKKAKKKSNRRKRKSRRKKINKKVPVASPQNKKDSGLQPGAEPAITSPKKLDEIEKGKLEKGLQDKVSGLKKKELGGKVSKAVLVA